MFVLIFTSSASACWFVCLLVCVVTLGVGALMLRVWATGGRFNPGPELIDNPLPFTSSRLTYWLSTLYLHARYAWLLVWPVHLSADYSFDAVPLVQSIFDARNLLTAGFYAGAHLRR